MSTDDTLAGVNDSATALGQSFLSSFADDQEFELDCEDCTRFVTIRGGFDDAVAYSRRHLDKVTTLCDGVRVTDADSDQELAIVFEQETELLAEQTEVVGGD